MLASASSLFAAYLGLNTQGLAPLHTREYDWKAVLSNIDPPPGIGRSHTRAREQHKLSFVSSSIGKDFNVGGRNGYRFVRSMEEKDRLEKSMEYRVRNYKSGDEAHLARIFSECFGPTTPRLLKQWHRRMKVLPQNIFIGEVERKPVSAVEMVYKELHLGEGVYLRTAGVSGVCTDSDYRRKGIVTNVMKLSLTNAENTGASNSSLYTGLEIPAHRIYSRLGFVDVMTNRAYVKYLDFSFVFARWIRMLNRRLKDSKIATRRLQGWEKSVAIELKEVGTLAFRFRRGRFERLERPPKKPDVVFFTDILTYAKIVGEGVFDWEEAVKTRKATLKRGEPVDVEALKRILRWTWEE